METWNYIKQNVEKVIQEIFAYHSKDEFTAYEKRKIIFEYLTQHITYDYEMLDKIKNAILGFGKVKRNPTTELLNVVENNHGICNAISQYYKLLLEQVGIKAYCIICDDGTEVKHQITLICNEETDSYSFDDVTSVIVGRGTIEEYFDYNIEEAEKHSQGCVPLLEGRNFVVLPEEYINFVYKRNFGLVPSLECLPSNIKSVKNKSSVK